MRTILCWAGIIALAALGWSATPAKKATSPKKTGTKAAVSPANKKRSASSKTGVAKANASHPASKTGVSKRATATGTGTTKAATRTTASRRGKKGGPPAKRTTWRNRQLAPTPERYQEIQVALAAKGYLKPEDANGTWTPASVDALKKFQAGQNLDSTGKINSLSLIALGLGPKHETATPKPNPENNPAPSQ